MLPARISHDLPRIVDRKGAAGGISRQRTQFAHSCPGVPDKSAHILSIVGIAHYGTRIIHPESFAVISSLEGAEITHAGGGTLNKSAGVASVSQPGATHDSFTDAVRVPSHTASTLPQSAKLHHGVSVAGP